MREAGYVASATNQFAGQHGARGFQPGLPAGGATVLTCGAYAEDRAVKERRNVDAPYSGIRMRRGTYEVPSVLDITIEGGIRDAQTGLPVDESNVPFVCPKGGSTDSIDEMALRRVCSVDELAATIEAWRDLPPFWQLPDVMCPGMPRGLVPIEADMRGWEPWWPQVTPTASPVPSSSPVPAPIDSNDYSDARSSALAWVSLACSLVFAAAVAGLYFAAVYYRDNDMERAAELRLGRQQPGWKRLLWQVGGRGGAGASANGAARSKAGVATGDRASLEHTKPSSGPRIAAGALLSRPSGTADAHGAV